MVAICPSWTTWSPLRLTPICSNSAGDPIRPTKRILWSLNSPLILPAGALVFWMRKALTTSLMETLYSRSFWACNNTDNSRCNAPLIETVATPSMALNFSAKRSSAKREISAKLCVVDDNAIVIIGSAEGSTRCKTGSRISVGNL